jgi:hypothetical protein
VKSWKGNLAIPGSTFQSLLCVLEQLMKLLIREIVVCHDFQSSSQLYEWKSRVEFCPAQKFKIGSLAKSFGLDNPS